MLVVRFEDSVLLDVNIGEMSNFEIWFLCADEGWLPKSVFARVV